MKAAVNQTSEKNITMVALTSIQASSYNPRKHFDEESLKELAGSIRQQGVLQPITVRPVTGETDRYEIVFGERRYRASVMAETSTIPAIISNYSDEEAEEMAITENLQRKDVTPMEEANAYQKLIESGRHTVSTLTTLFGKSESYIRTRLKFTSLIPEIATLLENDELTMSVASEICRYREDIQREVYEKHLDEDVMSYNSWRGLNAADVARRMEQNFTSDLKYYSFDKTLCASCPHNTNNLLLFNDGGCGHCSNRNCLADMNTSYLVKKAVQIMQERPTLALCQSRYEDNNDVVEQLKAMGHEVESHNSFIMSPKYPQEPKTEDFNSEEDYETARERYEQQLEECNEKSESIKCRNDAGKIRPCIRIAQKDITVCYVNVSEKTEDGVTSQTEFSPIAELEKRDVRNKEISLEKTIADTKKQIMEVDMTETKFSTDEEKMLYFFLLSDLRKEHFAAVGVKDERSYLTDEDKQNILANLTAKTKNIIRRDFLIGHFKNAYGKSATSSLLLDFAHKHMPDELAKIQSTYDEIYEKRHQRIEEKKAAILTQSQENEDTGHSEETKSEEAA